MSDKPQRPPEFYVVFQAILTEFAAMCERDETLRTDYLTARQMWRDATDDATRDVANDAFAAVLMQFMELRGTGGFTEDEMEALTSLRNYKPKARGN